MLKKVSFVILGLATISAIESISGRPHATAASIYQAGVEDTQSMVDEQMAVTAELPCIISRFDPIMRRVGEEQGQDWRLMSAIAYSESRFIENLVSSQGAAGIMQIRPIVARHFNVPVEKLSDTETNIRLASMLLGELGRMLRLPAEVSSDDRMKLILASYNAGVGHVQDARRLARAEGANPNSWSDVSRYLKLKADPTYYNKEEVRNGRFTGSGQTLSYVEEVMKKYYQYCKLA
ncbi:MAG: transglycosylase SLT domain-containing protein [Alistipes sp.]|nr:transglycosylase SLT domain-containing protein [Alistipes sp.]